MTTLTFSNAALALLAWREGQASGLSGMQAIAHMIVNRQKAGWGSLWDCVIQYETFRATTMPIASDFPSALDADFRKLLAAIDDITNRTLPDKLTTAPAHPLTGEAGRPGLYCAELCNVDREWFLEHICQRPDEPPRTATVGGLTFYG
jgi:hypothetical protein